MGLLNLFSKPAPQLVRLPAGTFTVDRTGRILVATVSSTVPTETVQAIAQTVLATFREAREAHLHLSELHAHFGSLKILARELRGGAIVFLSPVNPISPPAATPMP
jgi:hypothetical protein